MPVHLDITVSSAQFLCQQNGLLLGLLELVYVSVNLSSPVFHNCQCVHVACWLPFILWMTLLFMLLLGMRSAHRTARHWPDIKAAAGSDRLPEAC